MYVPMRIAATVLLSLTLVLLPDPGAAQMGPGKRCQCGLTVSNNSNFEKYFAKNVTNFENCPIQKVVRFILKNNKSICAKRNLPKVEEVVKCLSEDKKCSDTSDSKQEFSRGSNVNPSITSAKPPTTPLMTTKTTTQSEDQTTLLPTKEPTMPIQTPPHVRDPDTDKGDSSLRTGEEEQEQEQNKDPDGKMREMKIAIISLIIIVLAMVAVGTGLYCRKKRKGDLQTSCGSISYMHAPSEESIPVVKISQ